ncbi:hypothetical protein V2O64_18180 [Verrucomicrobiaceae bacterium 227]
MSFDGNLLKSGTSGAVTYRERIDAPVRFKPEVSSSLAPGS